jgi:hypothetical protein
MTKGWQNLENYSLTQLKPQNLHNIINFHIKERKIKIVTAEFAC